MRPWSRTCGRTSPIRGFPFPTWPSGAGTTRSTGCLHPSLAGAVRLALPGLVERFVGGTHTDEA